MKKTIILNCILLVFLMVYSSCKNTASKQTSNNQPSISLSLSTHSLEHNGETIRYQTCGEGDITLLFVHGWCINQSYWEHQVTKFCQSYKVVTLDLPGFGTPNIQRKSWTIQDFAKDVNTLIDQLKTNQVILIGHSMGGDIILETALQNDKVIALIGVDNFKDVGLTYSDALQSELTGFMNMLKGNFQEIAPAYAAGALFHPESDSLVINQVMEDFRTANPEVAISSLESFFAYAPTEKEKLAQFDLPLFLINSDFTPTDTSALAATGIDFKVLEIQETGHYPMVEKPELFNQLLHKAVEEIVLKMDR